MPTPAPPASAFCPICGDRTEPIFQTDRLPAEAHRLTRSRDAARAARRAPMDLRRCTSCQHGHNVAFDPALVAYDAAYHNPLHHALAYQHDARALAESLVPHAQIDSVEPYRPTPHIVEPHIVELGCGDGYFAHHLAQAATSPANATVTALDPAITRTETTGRLTLAPIDRQAKALASGSLVVARHVIEHLPDPVAWLRDVAGACPPGARVFIETPAADSMWQAALPWDLLYEHAHCFTAPSLAAAAFAAGLRVLDLRPAYGNQFVRMLAERPTTIAARGDRPGPAASHAAPVHFDRALADVRAALAGAQRPIVWGAGTKAITMLNLAGDVAVGVRAVVDVNPSKVGAFVAGTGTPIIAPRELPPIRPDLVVLANGLYRGEVAAELARLGVGAPIHTLVPARTLAS